MFLDNKIIKIYSNGKQKDIEVRVKTEQQIEKMEELVKNVRRSYPQYNIRVVLDDKFKIDNIQLNEITKFKNHINQNVKILIQVKDFKEVVTKKGKYFYVITASLPGKRKYIEIKNFQDKPMLIKKEAYYIVEGKIQLNDAKFIKKNKANLGMKEEYSLSLKTIEEYEFKEDISKHYEKPRAELHLHTKFSKNDAFITEKDLSKAFEENKLHTAAITDHGCVSAFIPYVNALKDKFKDTKKLILGCEFYAFSQNEYDEKVASELKKAYEELTKNSIEDELKEIEELNQQIKDKRTERNGYKRIMNRKTVSEDEKNEAEFNYKAVVEEIKEIENEIKILKTQNKEKESNLNKLEKKVEYWESEYGHNNELERDHLTVLLASEDEIIDYRGEELQINKGLVELYKLITISYQKYFSSPTDPELKKQGKRPMIPYELIFKPEIRKYFKISSACAFGKHMKLAVNGEWDEFRKWIRNLDAVEMHPTWNNIYMLEHEDYPNIKTIEDLYKLHRKIYEICKEENIPCTIVSDAHVNDKEDRIFRSYFKNGYINAIKSKVGEIKANQRSQDEDFSIEKQPFIMSTDDVFEDYKKQGFSDEEIQEMLNNTDKLAESCSNGFDITILPKKLLLPDFPNMNAKEELPKIVWKNAIKKWSKDGTKETIHPKILERINLELDIVSASGFEVLYMIARWTGIRSNHYGYLMGSRGSAGSMILTYLLEIGENNPLEPHYLCDKCHHVEFIDTELVGLDLEDKVCPECGGMTYGDGLNIEYHNFLGYGKGTKVPDIDLNISEDIQTKLHQELIEMFGAENAIKSGTQSFYQGDALIKDIFSHISNIETLVQNEEFDIDYMANETSTMRTTGQHPGGILVKPKDIPFEYITPLVNVSDKPDGEPSSFTVYHEIESVSLYRNI